MPSKDDNIYKSAYRDIIKVIKDFFNGDDKSIKWELLEQINKCVQEQNFERAARLRDIYNNIDSFTQRQSVILPITSIDGIFYKIIHIWSKWIYVIVVFQKWKLVDILRFEEDDIIDIENIISAIELDFGTIEVIKDDQWNTYGYNSHIKPNKSTTKVVLSHLDDFISSFISSITGKDQYLINNLLLDLQDKYDLQYYPYRIECLDISHINGSRASGWLSCMQWWLLYKKWYRQYKIKIAKWWDDYNSLKECIIRRFKLDDDKQDHQTLLAPDLFIIDGGPWQLSIVNQLLDKYPHLQDIMQHTQFVSIWKWSARKSSSKIYWEKEKLYSISDGDTSEKELNYDESDKLLVKCRDEAHRFANRYRKKQMNNEFKKK